MSSRPASIAVMPHHQATKQSAAAPQPPSLLNPSHVVLFVANLRLLDLDRLDDWPDITVQAFSTRDAQQNQKHRIRCSEWALFRLFEIWDPEETRNKLQPFFPPLEPLQSLNLRNALYRTLNDLKRNGHLGRETVLRKTMLDECKGDKFYEILCAFSTAVLRKVVTTPSRGVQGVTDTHAPIARRLALATVLGASEQRSMLPLAIAHRASLTALLRRKADERRCFGGLEEQLERKTGELAQRSEECKAAQQQRQDDATSLSAGEMVQLRKQLRDNWFGNPKWLDVILRGDESREDSFFERPFSEVWKDILAGESTTGQTEPGLFEQLDARVKEQQKRLQRWKAFHASISKPKATSAHHPSGRKYKDRGAANIFKFDAHQELKIGARGTEPAGGSSEADAQTRSKLIQSYHDLILSMHSKMENATVPRRPPPRSSTNARPVSTAAPSNHQPQRSLPANPAPPTAKISMAALRERAKGRANTTSRSPMSPSPMSPSGSIGGDGGPIRLQRRDTHQSQSAGTTPSVETPVEVNTMLGNSGSTAGSSSGLPTAPVVPSPAGERSPVTISSPLVQESTNDKANQTPNRPPAVEPEPESYFPPSSPPNEQEALAERILASVSAATPSPTKPPPRPRAAGPRPSLLERTRMSMAAGSNAPSFSAADIPAEDDVSSSGEPDDGTQEEPNAAPALDCHDSLLDRTRQSMSLLSHTQQLQHSAAARHRSSKASRNSMYSYPINQFETPQGKRQSSLFATAMLEQSSAGGSLPASGQSTPKERLFSEDADYASVFKSRPRIAMSPTFSPAGDRTGEGEAETEHEGEGNEGSFGQFGLDEALAGAGEETCIIYDQFRLLSSDEGHKIRLLLS
ncbi:HAUS augmin-like complex subunit 6 N-terminus-domain-containing protein [Lineolata rhizophorae]|uniref:HAUS augmin-like complex subunit 6 N-terminus-domain-containing protein n=1 Tax=Lineolata rhizophorae TaxID=578093 RepID=A0A6A6NUG2_9PEZI|nr:HAUS augmin-like complex subunit 6 N-terminus-domain-containing protein [Lineolata rhizophorae]